MSWHDDVVIANGVGQEIVGCEMLILELYDLLRAAEVGLGLIAQQRSLCNEVTREVARNLEDSDRTFFHIASNADADARFEVGVQFVTLHHVEWYCAVSKDNLACLRIDAGRVGLEARDA